MAAHPPSPLSRAMYTYEPDDGVISDPGSNGQWSYTQSEADSRAPPEEQPNPRFSLPWGFVTEPLVPPSRSPSLSRDTSPQQVHQSFGDNYARSDSRPSVAFTPRKGSSRDESDGCSMPGFPSSREAEFMRRHCVEPDGGGAGPYFRPMSRASCSTSLNQSEGRYSNSAVETSHTWAHEAATPSQSSQAPRVPSRGHYPQEPPGYAAYPPAFAGYAAYPGLWPGAPWPQQQHPADVRRPPPQHLGMDPQRGCDYRAAGGYDVSLVPPHEMVARGLDPYQHPHYYEYPPGSAIAAQGPVAPVNLAPAPPSWSPAASVVPSPAAPAPSLPCAASASRGSKAPEPLGKAMEAQPPPKQRSVAPTSQRVEEAEREVRRPPPGQVDPAQVVRERLARLQTRLQTRCQENVQQLRTVSIRDLVDQLPLVAADGAEEADRPIHEKLLSRYVRQFPGRCPCCCSCFGLLFVILSTVVGILLRPPKVETNFDSFMKTDVNTSTMRDTFLVALQKREPSRRLMGSLLYKHYDVSIAYTLREGVNGQHGLLDLELLGEVARFEASLKAMPEWQALCDGADEEDQSFCKVGISFANFALPTMTLPEGDVIPSNLRFDAKGEEPIPLETALLAARQLRVKDILLPWGFKDAERSAYLLRSVFRFKFRCCTSLDSMSHQRKVVGEMDVKWKAFAAKVLIPRLQGSQDAIVVKDNMDEEKEYPVRIYFEGTGLRDIEVRQTLDGDKNLAGGSMFFVLLYMVLHTKSLLLSLMGLVIIGLSVPFSYVVFALFTGSNVLSIASFLSLFLIVGLGSDVVFVYSDFWQESKQFRQDLESRLAWTLWHAGKASFATTATTAVSFFANLASVLKPLREFGFFMGLCVILAWLLLTLIFVPLCVLEEKYPCKRLCRWLEKLDGEGLARTSAAFGRWTLHLYTWRRTTLLGTTLLSVAFFAWAATTVTTNTGVPNIFPDDHNQNYGQEVFSNFAVLSEVFDPLFPVPPVAVDVCSGSDFGGARCTLRWCEVRPEATRTEAGTCDCFRKQRPPTCGTDRAAAVTQRLVGHDLTRAELVGPILEHIIHDYEDAVYMVENVPSRRDVQAPLILQEWESGTVDVRSVTELEARALRNFTYGGSSCGWEEICYCGTYSCNMPHGWLRTRALQLDPPARVLQMLPVKQWTVPSNFRAMIDVVFGLKVEPESPLLGRVDLSNAWSFNEQHEVWQPWAQRNMYSFCAKLPEGLRVTERSCWIEDFRRYVTQMGERFPMPREFFDQWVLTFASTQLTGIISSRDFLWIRDDRVKASYMTFQVDVHYYAAADAALEYRELWDAYLDEYNKEASRFSKDAWHTSSLWVRAEAQNELVSSTVLTLLIVILLAFVGMIVFTRNATLSCFVVFATLGVVSGLFFFITVMMSWAIGPIEVIALIVFIGYAVTYSLHIAHRYGSSDAASGELPQELAGRLSPEAKVRFLRVRFALQTIGSAALGSAVTTAGCSLFLVFCTLTIFKKLGGVVLAVTTMSIVMALAPLPALLLLMGPQDSRRCMPSGADVREGASSFQCALGAMLAGWPQNEPAVSERAEDPVCSAGSEGKLGTPGDGSASGESQGRISEMEFEIGTELPLEVIWTREAAGMHGVPRPMDWRRRPPASQRADNGCLPVAL